MKNRGITYIILVVFALIIVVIVVDFLHSRPDRLGKNPYAYDVEDFKKVDPSLIHYKETRNIPLGNRKCGGFDISGNELFIVGNNFLWIISTEGIQRILTELDGDATCIKVSGDEIFIGFVSHIEVYDKSGRILARWEDLGDRCVITSIAAKDDNIYVADAGNRRILIYDRVGNFQSQFEGKSSGKEGHGFIIPSPSFDVVVNNYGELWVVNPGVHAIENYTDDGELRGFWQKSSMTIEGFSGCCNPAEIAVTPDGDFITSEKGMVRVKIYDASGKLKSVVADPVKFKEEGQAPEIVMDEQGIIYALDFDRIAIRIFETINK